MAKPDFIIIGAMKCATSTLHAQLALQPGIFMTTPKEPNFFSDDEQYQRGFAWYEALFDDANPDDLCGEASTHYTKLPDYPHCVQRLAAYLPNVKLIYVMRHPIERLVSHYIHQWSQNQFTGDINYCVERYPELIAYSCYAKQLKPYLEVFGNDAILPVFFEAIKANPQQQLTRVAQFIGYQHEAIWQNDLTPENISRERIRKFPGYQWLIESKTMSALRRALIPQSIRDKVKKNLTMQQRPELTPARIEELTQCFNEDLSQLSQWLGIDINCTNFQAAAQLHSPNFIGWHS